MQERIKNIYDTIVTSHDTRANLEANKDMLLPFELVVATDTSDLLYKTEQGELSTFFGSSGSDPTEILKNQVDANTINIGNLETSLGEAKADINEKFEMVASGLDGKLPKGSYSGNADDLNPSKSNQVFSNHYYHKLYESGDSRIVFQHSYPQGYQEDTSNPETIHAIRTSKQTGTKYYEYRFGQGKILIDGMDINGSVLKNQTGYMKLANGITVQWGTIPLANKPSNFEVTLPVTYSGNGTFVVNSWGASGYSQSHQTSPGGFNGEANMFRVYNLNNPESGSARVLGYIAIGY